MYAVSPWLPVEVPGEPVVAVRLTERGTWTGEVPAIAVLTGSGRYLHLDAPDINDQGNVVVSPDGRRVAYWASGEPSGTPNTSGGQVVPVTGVAVVDVVTGDVERHDFETEHGLGPQGLLWAGSDTLLGRFNQDVAGDDEPDRAGFSVGAPSWRWDLDGTSEPVRLRGVNVGSFTEATAGEVLNARTLLDLATGEVRRLPVRGGTGSSGFSGSNAFLREDGVLAQLGGRGSADAVPNVVVTLSDLRAREVVQEGVPGTTRTWQVLGWRDGDLLTTRDPDGLYDRFEVVAVDIADGTSEVLLEGDEELLGWGWATDLMATAPVVDGVAPPTPMDPREVLGLGVTLLVVTVAGLLTWRRRVEP